MRNFKNILVTGGAGFIGSHIVDKLISSGYRVTILDNFDKQVHQNTTPKYLNKKAKLIKGSVTNSKDIKNSLQGIDTIYHHAAVVGVGQSMYAIEYYVKNNSLGTAKILDYLANNKHSVKRLFIASSMSAYGEGLYHCQNCGNIRPSLRSDSQMSKKLWDLYCPHCKSVLKPIPTPETEKFSCNSIYAITKQSQEDMFIVFGRSYNIATTAFRYFNVYGPRQSLSNPYTGVSAIFLSRLKNNNPPVIYEDGLQSRDFISVYDIAEANVLALENPKTYGQIFNLGTGQPVSIKDVSLTLSKLLNKNIPPNITFQFRSGDVKYCYADISKVKKALKWKPKISFKQGMANLIKWGQTEKAEDLFDKATNQLKSKGLIRKT